MELLKGRIGIVGLGSSNYELLKYLLEIEGYSPSKIFVSENRALDENKRNFLEKNNIEYEENLHSRKLFDCDSFAISPGISPNSSIGRRIRESGKFFATEQEIALNILKKRNRGVLVGVTGTNGKSTTVTMLEHILRKKHDAVFAGGNLGIPLTTSLNKRIDFYAIEISSFQLSWFRKREPYLHVSALLNIEEDHLDYHLSFEEYIWSKMILPEITEGYSIVRKEIIEKKTRLLSNAALSKVIEFSQGGGTFFDLENGNLRFHKMELPFNGFPLKETHNRENASIAIALAYLIGINPLDSLQSLWDYKALEYRMTVVGTINDVMFINDSKATNAHAVVSALKNFDPSRVVLILGGLEKKESYNELLGKLFSLKRIIIMGSSMKSLRRKLEEYRIPFINVSNMEEAVNRAYGEITRGDVVLFSPGGSSYDIYDNYKHRGDDFTEKVRYLKDRAENND
ncbi:MAG: UDP-N-acetylmuramoyl-L-alanine--D-glutamate ligase [Kosmotoga sp.]|nr:MAG: UDP-N-acetylmuramoyl-L-alanine--D-glutamate ligase [Kosmotoga sp.]